MNWLSFTQAMALRYRLPIMDAKIREARRILGAFLRRTENPYVAFSTGKDSLVALDLTLELKPETPAVWHDEHWVLPGTLKTLVAIEKHYGIHILRVRERYADDEFFKAYGVYPVCPDPRPVDFEADHWPEIISHYSFDGAIIALRSDESVGRRFALRQPLRWHQGSEEWRVSPVHNWSAFDVWAYIIGKGLPYHPSYERQIDAGVEIEHARVGPLTAVRVYQYGALTTIKKLYPDLWNEFSAVNPCVINEG